MLLFLKSYLYKYWSHAMHSAKTMREAEGSCQKYLAALLVEMGGCLVRTEGGRGYRAGLGKAMRYALRC